MKINLSNIKKPSIEKPKKSGDGFVTIYKASILKFVTLIITVFIICGVANMVKSLYVGAATELKQEETDIEQQKLQFMRSDSYYTGEGEVIKGDEARVEYIGTTVDGGRWSADLNFFWDYISPAFNYDSASEYNKSREEFINGKDGVGGLGHSLFTDQFLGYYDVEQEVRNSLQNAGVDREPSPVEISNADKSYTNHTDKSKLIMFPIGVTPQGDYNYIAYVPMKEGGSGSPVVAFTFIMRHITGTDNSVRLRIDELSCWPPDNSQLVYV